MSSVRSPAAVALRFSAIVFSVSGLSVTDFSITFIAMASASQRRCPLDAKFGTTQDFARPDGDGCSRYTTSILYIHGPSRLTTARQGKFLSMNAFTSGVPGAKRQQNRA
jgi:hypothetical protein